MKKYIVPELEISKFAAEDIMTGSSVLPELEIGGTAIQFGGDGNYSSNDLKWANDF